MVRPLSMDRSPIQLADPICRFYRYSSVIAQEVSGAAIEWAGGVGFTREVRGLHR
jgi:hypothetical protein